MVNVAKMLASYPTSHVAQKSVAVFKEAWVENVLLLTNCVDAITPLQDFMAITGKASIDYIGGLHVWLGCKYLHTYMYSLRQHVLTHASIYNIHILNCTHQA